MSTEGQRYKREHEAKRRESLRRSIATISRCLLAALTRRGLSALHFNLQLQAAIRIQRFTRDYLRKRLLSTTQAILRIRTQAVICIQRAFRRSRIVYQSASFMVRKPAHALDLEEDGSSDALFLSNDSLGVADGVGQWKRHNIDPGNFARELMTLSSALMHHEPQITSLSLMCREVLTQAYADSTQLGGSTAIVASWRYNRFGFTTLGDSRLIVLRVYGNQVHHVRMIFQSATQQHSFNHPYQLSRLPRVGEVMPRTLRGLSFTQDLPASALLYDLRMRPGDIVIAASDSLFDNVTIQEITSVAQSQLGLDHYAERLVRALTEVAVERSFDESRTSPFMQEMNRLNGTSLIGGKPDDTSVIVVVAG